MKSSSRRGLRLAAVVVTLAAWPGSRARAADVVPATSTPAPGDPAVEARQQYNAGTQAYAAKRFVEAALHFEAAAAQRAHAVTLYTAALAWEQANRPERAADDFGRAMDVPGLNAVQSANARERLATLEKTLGTLDVVAPEGVRVQLDALTEVAAPAKLHAMAGMHVLTIRAPDRPIAKRDVSLEIGQSSRIELAAEEAREPAVATAVEPAAPGTPVAVLARDADASASSGPLGGRRIAGVGLVGAGVATLGAAVVLGLSAVDAKDAYDAAPTRAALDHASSLQTWTNVALAGGAALTVGGALLALWPSSPRRAEPSLSLRAAPTLGGAAVWGTF